MAAERLRKYFFFVFVKIKVLPSSLFAVGRLHKLATFGELAGGIYPWISSSRCMYNLAKKQPPSPKNTFFPPLAVKIIIFGLWAASSQGTAPR